MGRSPDERLTSEVGREICQRDGIKAMLTGSIAMLGSQYVITLEAINAGTGESLGKAEGEAANKEAVLNSLGKTAATLREKLGESLPSVQKFDRPLDEVTTSSLEALKAFSLGDVQHLKLEDLQAVPFFQRAIELDPNFAMAHLRLGIVYENTGQLTLAAEEVKKAFDLRERSSEYERLYIAAFYYFDTGQVEKTISAWELMKQSYPRLSPAYVNEADVLGSIGEFQRAIDNQLEAIHLDPDTINAYLSGAANYRALGRFDEAKALLNQAVQRKIGGTQIHLALARTAALNGDMATADREWETAKASPQGEMRVMQVQISMAGAQGQIGRVRKLNTQLVEEMKRSDLGSLAARQLNTLAGLESDFGYSQRAVDAVNAALQLDQSWDVRLDVASILARDGDEKKAQALAAEVTKERSLDTLVQSLDLPALRAELDLRHKSPSAAIQELTAATPYEAGAVTDILSSRPSVYRSWQSSRCGDGV